MCHRICSYPVSTKRYFGPCLDVRWTLKQRYVPTGCAHYGKFIALQKIRGLLHLIKKGREKRGFKARFFIPCTNLLRHCNLLRVITN